MKIVVCGGGPSGLYFALLASKRLRGAEITVYEQNPRGATYGFGIVLADRGLHRMKRADLESYELITDASFQSRNRLVTHKGEQIFVEGGGYGGAIGRLRLLEILEACCERTGVAVHYDHRIEVGELPEVDLFVGADGMNSVLRATYAEEFGTTEYMLGNKLAWYGTKGYFPYPILCFKETARGQFWAVAYAYTEEMSTFVVECDAETWISSGFSEMDDDERHLISQELFAEELNGLELITNKSLWHSLPVTRNRNWYVGNRVLIGDALHSAHPSIGSGTRIAMEDSIALIDALEANEAIPEALAAFQRDRGPSKQKLIVAAEKSFNWYEDIVPRLADMDVVTLVFDYMMRTGRIDESRLMAEYPVFMKKYDAQWRAFNAARGA